MKPYLDLWTCRKLGVKKLTRESLEDWQLSRIRETFQWAVGRSPFYAELYQGMKADTWKDFRKLPFTSPADVCARGQNTDSKLPLIHDSLLPESSPPRC